MLHFLFIQQIYVLNILNVLHTLCVFSSSKCRLFHNVTFFGSCIIHILHTGCTKISIPNSCAKRLNVVPEDRAGKLLETVHKYFMFFRKCSLLVVLSVITSVRCSFSFRD